jgi:hypothetical protein
MGMFDTIIVDREFPLPLPDNFAQYTDLTVDAIYEGDFQTKDLDEILANYKITKDCKLFLVSGGWGEETPNTPRELKDDKLIDFYTYIEGSINDYWIQYRLTYTENTKEVKLTEFRATPNAERKLELAEREEARAKRDNLLKKWYMKPYILYRWLVRKIFRFYGATTSKLPPSYKVERFLTPL